MSNPVELSEFGRDAMERLRHARDQIAYFKDIEAEARAVIEAELGEAHDAATVAGAEVVTYRYVKSQRFDASALKRDIPDLHAAYIKTTEARRFVVKS